MARPLRLESEDGVYHVLNRGNYRADIFRGDKAKAAFLRCLDEACARTGWRVHAWCLMSNHYHLALSTPRANLVEGMRWLQGTFATRFNRLRAERGHLFQGRYKSLVVDPDAGLGPLCHYIHLNPVRARLRAVAELPEFPWTSLRWLAAPALRPAWYDPQPALDHAGALRDTPAGRKAYVAYLAWLAEDEPARKAQRFDEMSRGWIIGTGDFAKDLVREHRRAVGRGPHLAATLRDSREAVWQEELARLLKQHRTPPRRAGGRRQVRRLEGRPRRRVEGAHHRHQPLARHRAAPRQPPRSQPQGRRLAAPPPTTGPKPHRLTPERAGSARCRHRRSTLAAARLQSRRPCRRRDGRGILCSVLVSALFVSMHAHER